MKQVEAGVPVRVSEEDAAGGRLGGDDVTCTAERKSIFEWTLKHVFFVRF